MKNFIVILLFFISASTIKAQDNNIKTAIFSVKGNCDECKKRIENAADIKGVKVANWNETKQMLTVTYNSEKVSLNDIEKAVSVSGHDTDGSKSADAAYNKLPSCCKYRDKKCETPGK